MKLVLAERVRPGIPPVGVRLEVAERQLRARFLIVDFNYWRDFLMFQILNGKTPSKTAQLEHALILLFGPARFDLDHDPALGRRIYNPRIKKVAARYTPHAHDPRYLVYLEKTEEHDRKTFGRGRATTLGSDFHEIAKTKRLEREAAGLPKRKRKSRPIQSRPFPKGRGFERRPS